MKKLTIATILGVAIGIIIMQIFSYARLAKLERTEIMFELRVVGDFINVRTQPTTHAKKVYEVNKGELYDVLEVFDEDFSYTWYKITFSDRRVGWVASDNANPWVEKVE